MALTTHAPGDHGEELATTGPQLADLLTLANLSDDIFLVSDADGYITYANAAAERAHGDFAGVGRRLSEFIHEEDVGYPHLLKAMVARDGRAEARVMAKRGDGSPVMMIAEKAADRILGDEPLAPEPIDVYRAPNAGRFRAPRGP